MTNELIPNSDRKCNMKSLSASEIVKQNERANPLPSDPGASFLLEDINVNANNRLTIADLETSGAREIWVMNLSSGQNAGSIAFQVQGDNGLLPVEVPYTFVAVNLADYASPETLLRSESFRKVITKRLLVIVSPEYAEMVNASQQAQVELENIAKGIPVGVAESAYTINNDIQSNAPKTVAMASQRNTTDPEYIVDANIITVMNNTKWSEDEKLNLLRANKDRIRLVDALFIKRMASSEDYSSIVKAGKEMIKYFKNKTQLDDEEFTEHFQKATDAARLACRS